MPWTFAHPIAVLPVAKLSRNRLPLLALIIGSLSPDFGYYISMWRYSARAHDFIDSLYTALPICLLLILFFSAFRAGILQLLPPSVSRLVEPHLPFIGSLFYPKHIILIILATILGIWSHILWDSFTHKSPQFAGWWPFVMAKIELFGMTLPLYKLLQNMSSLLGAIGLGYLTVRAIRKQQTKQDVMLEVITTAHTISWQLYFGALLIISAGILSIFLYSLKYPILSSEIPHFLFINAITSSNIILGCAFLMIVMLQLKSMIMRH